MKNLTDRGGKMIEVNGKVYPFWGQFIEKKDGFIGCELEDFGDSMDRAIGLKPMKTIVTDITLKPNGEKSAFSV